MRKRTIYIIILFLTVSLIFAGFYLYKRYFYRYFYQPKQGQETKQDKKELTEEEIISKFTSPQPESSKTEYAAEQKKFIEDQTPAPTAKTTTDKKTEQIINQFTKPQ